MQRAFRATLMFIVSAASSNALDSGRGLSQYVSAHWTVQHGLPQDKIQALAQTADGLLWIATSGGVVTFDGIRFNRYDPPLAKNVRGASSRAMLVGRDGALWIAFDDGFVIRHAVDGDQVWNSTGPNKPTDARAIVQDHRGRIWIASDSGLFEARDGRLESRDANVDLVGAAVDSYGTLWVGGPSGLLRWQRDHLIPTSFAERRIYSLAAGPGGSLWIGGSNGLILRHYSGSTRRFGVAQGLPGPLVRTLCTDRDGNLWIGTWSGLARLTGDRISTHPTREDLSNQAINSLFEDREGNLWIGTRGAGLLKLRNSTVISHSPTEGMARPDVQTIEVDRTGRIWTGNANLGPSVFDGTRWRVAGDPRLFADSMTVGMAEDALGGMWLAVEGRPNRLLRCEDFHCRIMPLPPVSDRVPIGLRPSRDGRIWAAFGDQLWKGSANGRWEHIPLHKMRPHRRDWLFEEDDRGVWLSRSSHRAHR